MYRQEIYNIGIGILLYVRLIQTPLETIVQKRLKSSLALDHKQFDSP